MIKIITRKDWEKAEKKGREAFENTRECRKAVDAETTAVTHALNDTPSRVGNIKDICLVVRTKSVNYGTRKWSDWRRVIDVVAVHPAMYRETAKTLYGIRKDTILCVVKRG